MAPNVRDEVDETWNTVVIARQIAANLRYLLFARNSMSRVCYFLNFLIKGEDENVSRALIHVGYSVRMLNYSA